MGVVERRAREKSETRDKILDAARELFVTEGYEGVSMRKLAEKIEYSPTAIYAYFADKEDLFHQLCQEDFARLAEVFQSSAMSPDPVARIQEIGRVYVEFGIRYPNHYKLMFMTPHPAGELDEEDREVKGNPERDAYALLLQTVQQAIAAGSFREDIANADLISQTMWAATHGVISLQIAKCNDSAWVDWRPMEQRTTVMLDAILRGLLKSELTTGISKKAEDADMPPARRNLFHDKVRLIVTVTGIVFAVVLIVVELGLFVGFTETTSSLIDHSGADLWVTSRHVPYVEMGVPFSERKLYQVRAVPGVLEAQKTQSAAGRSGNAPTGSRSQCRLIGIDPRF